MADSLLERLRAIPYSGAIADVLVEEGHPDQVLPWQIRPLTRVTSLVGRAVTVEGRPATEGSRDDYFVPYLQMLASLGVDDVIVSQPNDDICAHLGELSAETAQYRGARGAVIDGGVRDLAYIDRLGFPVFARYCTPVDIVDRWQLSGFGEPVSIGRTAVATGDLIVGDVDGVVVIPSAIAERVVTRTEEVIATENLVRRDILAGVDPVTAYHRHGRF